jgi:hypothetical protein
VSACCCEQFFSSAIADEFVHKAHVLLDSSGLKSSALKSEHPALQNKKFLYFSYHFRPPVFGSGSSKPK